MAKKLYQGDGTIIEGIGSSESFEPRPENGYENFKVSVNYFKDISSDTPTDNVLDGNIIYDDYCVIALPNTYKASGEKTRLIIHCGGTGNRIAEDTNPLKYPGWTYFLEKGYAVMDCNGIADEYITNVRGGGSRNHFGCKYLLQSYKKAYDYVMDRYNLKKDGIFVTGISMGGLASFMIVQSGIFPVLAQFGFCPCISIFAQAYINPWDDNAEQIPKDWGFDEKLEEECSRDWFIRNYPKIAGFDSLMKNVIGDKTNIFAYLPEEPAPRSETTNLTKEKEIYDKLLKIYPCPLKIIHAKGDSIVRPQYSRYIVTMIRNAGGYAELHELATGSHGEGWNAGEKVDDEGITTTINFYECIKFIQRYEK